MRTCCADLDVGKSVPRHNASDITPLQFQQQFVARNKPVVLTSAIEHWPALKLWSAEYLLAKIGNVEVCCLASSICFHLVQFYTMSQSVQENKRPSTPAWCAWFGCPRVMLQNVAQSAQALHTPCQPSLGLYLCKSPYDDVYCITGLRRNGRVAGNCGCHSKRTCRRSNQARTPASVCATS